MARYVLARIVLLVPVLIGVSLVTFSLIRLVPGDPVAVVLGSETQATPQQVAAIRAAFGLDEPAPLQYVHWLGRVLSGDLGTSFRTGRSLSQELALRLPVTLELSMLAAVLGIVPALLAGTLSALRRNSPTDYVVAVGTLAGLSFPNFLLATLLVLLFSVVLRWLPPIGYVELRVDPIGNLRTMLLPAVCLALPFAGVMMRITRSSVLEVLGQDYVRAARSKGLRHGTVLRRHVLRNAAIPVITVAGLSLARLLGGAVIVETIFGLPGIGRYVFDAISTRDYPVVQGVTLVVAVAFVLVSLLIDVLYAVVDPRLRTSH
ncbi:MAG: ABC transporter permease [Chloroflexi bacterium]|nr:ABC transporter permease [Chloroflexota bacterium]MBV9596691.1 ABC transporter permease [Chloroflexota bacterium]